MTTKQIHKFVLEWKPIDDRIIKARYNSAFAKLTVIVCYAPTEDSEDDEKNNFYQNLQKKIDETPSHDVLLIMGDLHAKVGSKNKGRANIMGKHGIGVMNDNGERLTSLCQENRKVIGGTIFHHKDIHKLTWTSPDGHTQNQIEHIMINNRWRGSLRDVKAKRGADVGSDHTLTIAKIKLKLRAVKRKNLREPPLDVSKLKDSRIKKTFQIEVRNIFSILQSEQELDICQFSEALIKSGKKILGPRKKKKKRNGSQMQKKHHSYGKQA